MVFAAQKGRCKSDYKYSYKFQNKAYKVMLILLQKMQKKAQKHIIKVNAIVDKQKNKRVGKNRIPTRLEYDRE